MKTKIFFLLFIGSTFLVNGQSAREILDKANQAFIDANGIQVSFTLNVEDMKQKITYSQDGTIDLQGNKFKIEVPDGITWFDGKTQWTYLKGSNEVNVSNPTGEELSQISPAILLQIYKKGFQLINNGVKQERGKSVFLIELIPENKKSDFTKMSISLDKANYLFSTVQIYYKDGTINHILINKLKTQVKLPGTIFVFNKTQYPDVEIVDLR